VKKVLRAGRVISGMAIVMALGAGVSWSGGPAMRVQTTGSHRPAGRPNAKWISLSAIDKIARGDRILYHVQIMNQGDRAAKIPVAVGPIPLGTAYVPGTATRTKNVDVQFSIDGGRTFSPSPAVALSSKDGKRRILPAPPERYTTVRWRWDTPLPVGAKAVVSYQVQVR